MHQVSLALAGLLLHAPLAAAQPVAYLAWTDGYWQVWLTTPDGDTPRQLTHSLYEKRSCSWFPDGERLLVNALDGRLFEVHARTSAERAIEVGFEDASDAVIAPDGRQIAFAASTSTSVDDREIWLVDVSGQNPRQLTHMSYLQHGPAWSPKPPWIYFLSGRGRQSHDIWRVSAENGSREQITVGAAYHFDLAVSPDGRIAYSGNRTGNYEIFSLRFGEAPVQWTDHPALDAHPTWSPDGEGLIFQSARSGALNLWRITAPGAPPRQLTHHENGARAPVWWDPPGATS